MRQTLTNGMLERLGIRSASTMNPQDDITSEIAPSSLADDYEALITDCLRLLGLSPESVRVSVRPVGVNPTGLDIYAAFIKVVRWDDKVVKALSRMPTIEKKIEGRIKVSVGLRYSAFAGLWFHTPSKLEEFGTLSAVH